MIGKYDARAFVGEILGSLRVVAIDVTDQQSTEG